MKTGASVSKRRNGSWIRLLSRMMFLPCLCLSVAANAQTVDYKETLTTLQTRVHLKLGETTLAKTLQALSKQTGLQIQPEEYLEDRELLVELDNMSAQAVLDTLAEANDWRWYEGEKSHLFMARPKFNQPQRLIEVAPAFRVIVPKDLRRFVGVDVSDTDLRSAYVHLYPKSGYALTHSDKHDSAPPRLFLLPEMLNEPLKEREHEMISWVTDEVKTGKKIPYAKLTPEQQHDLLVQFVFTAFHTILSPGFVRGGDNYGIRSRRSG